MISSMMISMMIASIIHGVDIDLVDSIIKVESNYKAHMTGSLGEIGLMQIRKEYWKGPLNLYDPSLNVEFGILKLSKLKRLKKKLGNFYFTAYNLGPSGALKYNKYFKISKFKYSKKIMKELYKNQYKYILKDE